MSIRIGRPEKPVGALEVDEVERALHLRLPENFRAFLDNHNGATPETNIFAVGRDNESGINAFIPVDQILGERARLEPISPSAIPIAWAEGGNYVLLDLVDRTVSFWDHEDRGKLIHLANSLAEFLQSVKPFDVSQVDLRPNQVKKAWIDPELLKRRHP